MKKTTQLPLKNPFSNLNMMHYLFSRTADFALTGEKRLLNEESKAPEKPADTPSSSDPKHAELSKHFKEAIKNDPLLGKALRDAVLQFIKEQVRDADATNEAVKHKALAVINTLEEIKKMPHEKVMELRNAIPANRAQLVAIAINAGFLTMEDAMGAAAEGGKAAPGEVSINEFSKLNDPDLYAAIDDVRIQLRRQAAGAPKDKQREAMDKYRKLNAVLDARKGMTIPDLVRRAPHYLPTSTQPTAQQQMADVMSRNAQRERFEETYTGDPLLGNSRAAKDFQNAQRRRAHEAMIQRSKFPGENERYNMVQEMQKDDFRDEGPRYEYKIGKNFRPAPRMGADGKMHEVDMDQYMYYQPGTPGGFFDRNSVNNGRDYDDSFDGESGGSKDKYRGVNGRRRNGGAYDQVQNAYIKKMGGARYLKNQELIIVGNIKKQWREIAKYKDLETNPRTKDTYVEIMIALQDEIEAPLKEVTDMYHALARARTRLENLARNEDMSAVNETMKTAKALHTIRIDAKSLYGDSAVTIYEDPEGAGSITPADPRKFQAVSINDPRMWGEGMLTMGRMSDWAKDRGIYIERTFASVRRVGRKPEVLDMNIKFTKPGRFRIEGPTFGAKTIVVNENGSVQEDGVMLPRQNITDAPQPIDAAGSNPGAKPKKGTGEKATAVPGTDATGKPIVEEVPPPYDSGGEPKPEDKNEGIDGPIT